MTICDQQSATRIALLTWAMEPLIDYIDLISTCQLTYPRLLDLPSEEPVKQTMINDSTMYMIFEGFCGGLRTFLQITFRESQQQRLVPESCIIITNNITLQHPSNLPQPSLCLIAKLSFHCSQTLVESQEQNHLCGQRR